MGDFNTHEAERFEADLLLDKGVKFDVEKKSFLRHFSKKKNRTFTIKQPYLGTLDHLSALFLEMKINEMDIEADPNGESKRLVNRSSKSCARVVAVAVLNSKWGIRLFTNIYAAYFMWRVTPKKMWQLAVITNQMCNLGDFTNSIRLMSGARTMKPKVESLVEKANEV